MLVFPIVIVLRMVSGWSIIVPYLTVSIFQTGRVSAEGECSTALVCSVEVGREGGGTEKLFVSLL